jgi:SAM-dependent methyltransferase
MIFEDIDTLEKIPDYLEKDVFFSSEQIARLNSKGARFTSHTIRMIDECRDAVERLPTGAKGIVIGPGDNASSWHDKGWETIDILGSVEPTYVADANQLAEVTKGTQYDFVLSEYVTLHPEAGHPTKTVSGTGEEYDEPAVGHEQLLLQANQVLKPGGRLIIKTVDFGQDECSVPKAEEFAVLLRKNGFAPVLEVRAIQDFTDPKERKRGVKVIWYAEKINKE